MQGQERFKLRVLKTNPLAFCFVAFPSIVYSSGRLPTPISTSLVFHAAEISVKYDSPYETKGVDMIRRSTGQFR